MKHLRWALTLPVFAAVVAGCGTLSDFSLEPGVSVVSQLSVVGQPAGRQVLQTVESPWRKADIVEARLKLYRVGTPDTQVAELTLAKADLDSTFTFNNLRRNTDYKITAEAFASDSVQIDNLAIAPTTCTTEFSTSTTSPVMLSGIVLQLRNRSFSGGSQGASLTVTDGGLDEPTASETITIGAP